MIQPGDNQELLQFLLSRRLQPGQSASQPTVLGDTSGQNETDVKVHMGVIDTLRNAYNPPTVNPNMVPGGDAGNVPGSYPGSGTYGGANTLKDLIHAISFGGLGNG